MKKLVYLAVCCLVIMGTASVISSCGSSGGTGTLSIQGKLK